MRRSDGLRDKRRRCAHSGFTRSTASSARRRRPLRGLWTMCGIFGAVARTGGGGGRGGGGGGRGGAGGATLRHPESIPRMAAALKPPGPDGECIVGNERARIGGRRLAIMELTTAEQPF